MPPSALLARVLPEWFRCSACMVPLFCTSGSLFCTSGCPVWPRHAAKNGYLAYSIVHNRVVVVHNRVVIAHNTERRGGTTTGARKLRTPQKLHPA